MLLFNNSSSYSNPFGFEDKSANQTRIGNIQSSATEPSTSKCRKKKLTKRNITFLKSLGLTVKKH